MNYILKVDKNFTKLNDMQNNLITVFSKDLKLLEDNILDTLVDNEKLQEFIYPTLTTYNDNDKLNVISKTLDIECDHIDKFGKDVKLNNNSVISVINNINNITVINTICNLNNIYEHVYICNLFYDNPTYNIHYIVCKNKINKDADKLDIITNNICLNENLDDIYNYIYSFYSSVLILIKIYNIEQDTDNIYKTYCDNFKNIN